MSFLVGRCTCVSNFVFLGPVNVLFLFILLIFFLFTWVGAGRPVLRREHRETTSFLAGYLLSGSSLVYRYCCLLSARALIDTG